MKLDKSRILRRIFLPLFARFNPGDITISHHFTGDRIRLHSYRHKGYWYHGKRREADTMRLFREFIARGATVLDVGGHCGYVAIYLASLVGPRGRVIVFEPGPNNLPYLKHNTRAKRNITLVEKGVGSRRERRPFYLESLTGQNNSFLNDFAVFKTNKKRAYAANAQVQKTTVDVVTLDEFCRSENLRPDLIKIDVEGFELEVLKGALSLLRDVRPMLMVEIQVGHKKLVQLAKQYGYRMFTPQGNVVAGTEDLVAQHTNTFWLHQSAHAKMATRFRKAA
jgi:FkbM family methyltransferase